MERRKRLFGTMALLACILLLPACSAGGEDADAVTLTFATLGDGSADQYRNMISQFNLTHRDVKISVKEYSSENGRSGKDRLMVEMAAGRVPDIIDLGNDAEGVGRLPYAMLAQKGFLVDLWPYIASDPELGRDGVLEAPLKAAEVDGGLYTVFGQVHIETLIGPESLVGDRKSWTLSEMQEAFMTMPEGSTILAFTTEKREAFYYIFSKSIETFVDWNTGKCSFTGETFQSSLQFVNSFLPEFTGPRDNIAEEIGERILSGRQMLNLEMFANPRYIQVMDTFFGRGGKAAFIGFPVEDGSVGSSFYINGRPLAMTAACSDKAAAWEFLRNVLLPKYKNIDDMAENFRFLTIPINHKDYDLMIRCVKEKDLSDRYYVVGLPMVEIHRSTEEEIARYEDLLNSIETISLYDTTIYDIALEVAGAYFVGDITVDEASRRIQERVTLYLNENPGYLNE